MQIDSGLRDKSIGAKIFEIGKQMVELGLGGGGRLNKT